MDVAARQMAREAAKRWAPDLTAVPVARIGDMLSTRFDRQLGVIHRTAKRKAVLCTRRAGKTETAASYLLKAASENSDCVAVFVGPTRIRAKALMWKALKRFNERFGFGGRPNEVELTLHMSNGSEVRLDGADKLKDADKKRGDRMCLVIIDEASVYSPDVLQALIDDVFGPALEDLPGGGTIVLMGTPGVVCAGYWYEVTRNETDASRELRAHGWDVIEWSVLDNPFMGHMKARLPEIKKERGWDDNTPTFRREWRGLWTNDSEDLFYSYSEMRNAYETLPPAEWNYVMGVDLGFDDAFATTVLGFHPASPVLYEIESASESELTPDEWLGRIIALNEKYSPRSIRVDTGGLGKAIVEGWKVRCPALPLEAAKKTDKAAAVKILNGDLVAGLIKVLRTGPLAVEWKMLPKDPDNELAEDPRFPNHISDAFLYAHREARHFLGEVPEEKPAPGTQAYVLAETKRMEEAMAKRVRQRISARDDEDVVFGFEPEKWEDDLEEL